MASEHTPTLREQREKVTEAAMRLFTLSLTQRTDLIQSADLNLVLSYLIARLAKEQFEEELKEKMEKSNE